MPSAPSVAGGGRLQGLSPGELVRQYLERLSRGQCAAAGELCSTELVDDCRGVTELHLRLVREYPPDVTTGLAQVQADFDLRGGSLVIGRAGCYVLARRERGWVITGFGRCDSALERAGPAAVSRPPAPLPEPPRGVGAAAVPPQVVVPRPPPLAAAPAPGAGSPDAPPAPDPVPRVPLGYGYADPVPSPPPGSAGILGECWGPEKLAGPSLGITKKVPIDRRGPPPEAITAARQGLGPLRGDRGGSIRGVEPTDPGARLVALTFDLCEQANEYAGYQAEIVNYLRENRIKATFFAGGQWMRSHPEQTQQLMADPLFEIGNHAWTHGNLRVLHGEDMRNQILWTQAEYGVLRDRLTHRECAAAHREALARIPRYPRVFRFPYGTCDPESLAAVADLGLAAIQWGVVAGDPDRGASATAIAARIIEGVKRQRGAIVVAHANGRGWHTAEALPRVIHELKADHYELVKVSEPLDAGHVFAPGACYEVRPEDNQRYDKLFGRGTGE